jgi:tetratricopeptide (TPR) repeat protein
VSSVTNRVMDRNVFAATEFFMRFKFILPILVLVVAIGCKSDSSASKPSYQQTQKAAATEQWNSARANVLCSLANEQYKNGNLDQARQTINKAVGLDPKNMLLRILSAKIAIEQAQLELADQELAQAEQYDPKNGEADYLRGVVYQRWQKADQALKFYQQASEKDPTELAYVLAAGEMLVQMDRQEESLSLLQGKLDLFEHAAPLRDAIGQLLVGQGKYAEAVEQLRQATMLATDDPTIKEHLALALYFNKQYRESADFLTKLVADDQFKNRGDLHLALGECYENMDRLNDAKAEYETATQVTPNSSQAWSSLAKVSLEKNDVRRAELSAGRAIAIDPASADSQLLLGYIRLRENRLTDAMGLFQKAAALNRVDPVCVCMIGYIYEKTGKADQAVQCYAKALKLHPGDELATRLMASVEVNQ